MANGNWHALKAKEVLQELKSSSEGLTQQEAGLRFARYGANQLREFKKIKPLSIFLKQFRSVLVYILLAAVIISALLQHWLDSGVIAAIIILNSALGFVQEYKAEKALQRLRMMLVPKATVLRRGRLMKIDSTEIVPGDVLVLSEGDKIMGDARLLEAESLQTNEAVLTGESMPEDKSIDAVGLAIPLADRTSMIYMGTSVVRGNGKAVVVATGMRTEFGRIAGLVQKVQPTVSPLREKLDSFAKKLGAVILGLAVLIALIGILLGFDKLQMFLTGVSLAVSAVPEGLPAVITVALAFTVQRMLKVKTLIRKLPAAETLGRTTVICADKTGTMTAEEMTVRRLYVSNKAIRIKTTDKFAGKFFIADNEIKPTQQKELSMLLKIGCLCNNARIEQDEEGKRYVTGDPTEVALLLAAAKAGFDKRDLTKAEPKEREFPFTSERKLMSIVRRKDNKLVSYVKGAPDVLLQRCTEELVDDRIVKLTDERRKQFLAQYENMARSALRVIGCAFKILHFHELSQSGAENGLIFVGFQGMLDPPRPEVRPALAQCSSAGVKTIMLTGDSSLTAAAIGKEIGLNGKILTATDIDKMSDAQLHGAVKDTVIFARITPQHKLQIVEALKDNGEVVAVTGDGVNDALALKRADIGIAMGIRGTDVARDTSDMILLDDNFASIVKAVKEGRRSFDNTRKFIKYLLSVNFSELAVIVFSIMMAMPLPLLPLQILWINLVTDSLPALALGVEPAEADVMRRSPTNPKKGILAGLTKFIVIAGALAFVATIVAFSISHFSGLPIEKARTMALTTSIMFEMLFIFTCRSDRSLFKIGLLSNKWLLLGVGAAVVLHLIAIYTPLSAAFQLVPLGLGDWGTVLGLGLIGLVVFEIAKIIRKK